jgi:hypothetical protein
MDWHILFDRPRVYGGSKYQPGLGWFDVIAVSFSGPPNLPRLSGATPGSIVVSLPTSDPGTTILLQEVGSGTMFGFVALEQGNGKTIFEMRMSDVVLYYRSGNESMIALELNYRQIGSATRSAPGAAPRAEVATRIFRLGK